jgi:hypothetical protein
MINKLKTVHYVIERTVFLYEKNISWNNNFNVNSYYTYK